jgi:hypothetical protein
MLNDRLAGQGEALELEGRWQRDYSTFEAGRRLRNTEAITMAQPS